MNPSQKIFVAGHGGMVGSAIVRALRNSSYDNVVTRTRAELDLTRQDAVEQFFEEERPEYVFLAAAKVGGIVANSTYKAEFIRDNMAIALNVIDAAHKSGVVKLLNLGSSCIYPKHAPQPMSEEHLLTGALEPTNEPYAIAKIAAIKLCRYYNEQYGTDFISVMPTNLYGENDNFNLETAHVLPSLIRKFHLARLLRMGDAAAIAADVRATPIGFGLDATIDYDNPATITAALESLGITADGVTLWGTGTPMREFLHASDLAGACLFLMKRYGYEAIGEFVNVGMGEDLSIDALARLTSEVVGYDGPIQYDSTKPDGTPRKLLDISRLTQLGWAPRVTLRDGIERMVAWYRRDVKRSAHEGATR